MAPPLLLAIDQGTTSSRALLFQADGTPVAVAQTELPQSYPAPGRVEHDPMRIWADVRAAVGEVLARPEATRVVAIGITNQRETSLIWRRADGRPIAPAIVWQDRRGAAHCRALREAGHEALIQAKTGLLLDPYFSATKVAWLLANIDGARDAAARGELAFGTIDSWLLWCLTGGRVHATDATNASRTQLFNIVTQDWDDDLLALFDVPRALLPEVRDSAADFGATDPDLFGRAIPIRGIAGDQQAATFGQAAYQSGEIKSTYGTGCFALINTGETPARSTNRLLTTVAWRLDGRVTYALEGSIFVAGAAVKWLRDGLGVIADAARTADLAAGLADNGGVYLVPAFTGLGAPHWDPDARGTLVGLTLDSGPAHLARAALEAVGYQTRDLLVAMAADLGSAAVSLKVDGGMAVNDWAMQFLADILDLPVERPRVTETTAAGVAYLAGLASGVYPDLAAIRANWRRQRRFQPAMAAETRARLCVGWRDAVGRATSRP